MAQRNAWADLELFNEKVDRLSSLSFFSCKSAGAIVEFRRETGWESIFVGPDEESTEALVLTLRLFMQDNDRLSLKKMRALYETLLLPSDFATRFTAECLALNSFLDADTNLAIDEEKQLTYRDILRTYIYGTYAHVDNGYRKVFLDIRKTPFAPLFQACLVQAMMAFHRCLVKLRHINEEALRLAPVVGDA